MDKQLNEIEYIVGSINSPYWNELNPKIYYKNDLPFGLIATKYSEIDDILYLGCTTSHPDTPFSKAMLYDILSMYNKQNICLMTDHIPSQAKIASLLTKRYGFTVEYIGDVLYSYHMRSE